jgi:hypothetical protein
LGPGNLTHETYLKPKNFVSIPSDIEPGKLTLAQAEELYKKMSKVKKAADGH